MNRKLAPVIILLILVSPTCGPSGSAPAATDTAKPPLEPTLPEPPTVAPTVTPGRINIRETHSPGFIERVDVIDETGKYHTVWQGQPAPVDECPRVFSILVTGVDVPIVAIRIHLDQRDGGNWNEIDAVELIGIETTW